ncbi:MAG TPA: hypothetical protein VD968_13715 [Pyrinomonadaceae bacterium]|nr:hypothetical protein [Pyrinomonadaceae bacterium]
MPVKESSATALVRFTGLGIVCFNEERGRGEIAAIRDDKHRLSVRIQRPVFQDGAESDIVVYQDLAAYTELPREGVSIEMRALGEPAVEGFEIYQRGQFDRLGHADVNDFRWIVNMSALHGGAPLRPTGQRRHPLTKIYIGNGLFYTHKLATNLFFEKVEAGTAGGAARREVFGNVGETIGVVIEGSAVVFTLRAGGREETHTLMHVPGLPFRVEIKNMDYSENAIYSDMADYYGYLASPTGERFDLEPVLDDDEGGGGSVNQQQFCHPVATDYPSSVDDI